MSRTNSVVSKPQSVARTNTISSSHSANGAPPPMAKTNSVVSKPRSVARTNTISSSHSASRAPPSVSRTNSSASARQEQGTVSRSNSTATVRSAATPPSVSRNGSISSDHRSSSPLSRAASNSSNHEPRVPRSLSRANSAATIRSSSTTPTPTRPQQPVSRSNSVVSAGPPISVSRSNSTAAVTAISLHETSSIVRSNTRASALTSVSARSKATRNYSDRLSMLTFTSALSDLPSPPYSHPKDYEALVDAMLQELYRLNPEWVERKRRLQQVCVHLTCSRRLQISSSSRDADQSAARGRKEDRLSALACFVGAGMNISTLSGDDFFLFARTYYHDPQSILVCTNFVTHVGGADFVYIVCGSPL